jgi:trigger factor
MEQLGITKETLSEKYRDTAEKQARRHLILGKIIQQEDMAVSQEEIDEGFNEITELYAQPIEEIKKFYHENPDKLEVFKHALLEKKAIHLIINHGSIEEKEPELEQKPEENTE